MKHLLYVVACSTALICSAHAESVSDRLPEHIGFGSGALLGAVIAGPVGAIVASTIGVMMGHDVLQDRALVAEQSKRTEAESEQTLAYQARDRAVAQLKAETIALQRSQADVRATQQQLQAIQQVLEAVSIPVYFDLDSATAHARHEATLAALADALSAVSTLRLELTGYADTSGSSAYNQTLSDARAASIGELLIGSGLDLGRIQMEGRGEATMAPFDPITSAVDRRVEIQFRFDATERGVQSDESLYSIR